MDEKVKDYILDLVFATREAGSRKNLREIAPYISVGASPRATISLAKGAKAKAFDAPAVFEKLSGIPQK